MVIIRSNSTSGVHLKPIMELKNMKIKCVKVECPVCKASGSIQLFFNNSLELRYDTTRYYSHLDKVSRKPQFTYCKLNDLEALKTLLLNNGISLNTDEARNGQVGQWSNRNIRDQNLQALSFKLKNGWAGSSVRIEHHPPKVGVVGSNPTPPATNRFY